MAPPSFSDFMKGPENVDSILNDDFDGKRKMKIKAGGLLGLVTDLTWKKEIMQAKTTIKPKLSGDFKIDKVVLAPDGLVTFESTYSKSSDLSVKLATSISDAFAVKSLSSPFADSGGLNVSTVYETAALRIDAKADLISQKDASISAVLAQGDFMGGAMVALKTPETKEGAPPAPTELDLEFGARFASGPLFVACSALKKFEQYALASSYKVSDDLSMAFASVAKPGGDSGLVLDGEKTSIGFKQTIGKDLTVKGRAILEDSAVAVQASQTLADKIVLSATAGISVGKLDDDPVFGFGLTYG